MPEPRIRQPKPRSVAAPSGRTDDAAWPSHSKQPPLSRPPRRRTRTTERERPRMMHRGRPCASAPRRRAGPRRQVRAHFRGGTRAEPRSRRCRPESARTQPTSRRTADRLESAAHRRVHLRRPARSQLQRTRQERPPPRARALGLARTQLHNIARPPTPPPSHQKESGRRATRSPPPQLWRATARTLRPTASPAR